MIYMIYMHLMLIYCLSWSFFPTRMMWGYLELTSFYLLIVDLLGTLSDRISRPAVCLLLPSASGSHRVQMWPASMAASRTAGAGALLPRSNITTEGVFTGDYMS